jgi:hypothetical protein
MIKLINFDTRKTEPRPDGQSADKADAPPPPKNQLRRRVEARIAELEAELERLGDDPAKHKQIRAIRAALKGVHDTMSLNSANVGTMEAAQMTRWLESVRYLAVGSSSAPVAPQPAAAGETGSSEPGRSNDGQPSGQEPDGGLTG